MQRLRDFLSKPTPPLLRWLLWLAVIAVIFFAVHDAAILLYNVQWTGFGSHIDAEGKAVPAKTLWDWLGLLIVPLFLLVGGVWINSSIQRREREIADDRLKEQALQNYLDRMSDLLLKGHFDDPDTKDNARAVSRAWTLTTLRGLNGERKGAVLSFLYESGSITGDHPIIDLSTADFSKAHARINLTGANLTRTNFMEANLEFAILDHANLHLASLQGANLAPVILAQAYLNNTNFEGANLEGAFLMEADLTAAVLANANLKATNLQGANLKQAKFLNADLQHADLQGVTNFWKTDLSGANLRGAKIALEQLAKAILDENTILPDGSHWKPPQPNPPQ